MKATIGLPGRELFVEIDRITDPSTNLKKEDETFERVESGDVPEVVRLWVDAECLVRGRAKSSRYGWYDAAAAERLGIPVLERSTGGGVVYHDPGNLNWSFFLRTSGAYLSPKTVFGQASRYLVEALRSLGVPAQYSPPNRIDVSGRKVSGMAARSTVRTLLVHGTLLINSDLEKLNLLCVPPSGCPPVSNLREWLKGIDADTVAGALVEVLENSGFRVSLSGKLNPGPESKVV